MSKRDDRVSLVDMLVHATEAVELLGAADREDLERDRVVQVAAPLRSFLATLAKVRRPAVAM